MAQQSQLPNLQQALAIFVEGAKAQGVSNALSEANTQVKNIKEAQITDQQRRSALQELANKLVMDMTARGASATSIEQAYGAVASKRPQVQTAEQAILMGDEEQQQLGTKMRAEDNKIKQRVQEDLENRSLRLMGAREEVQNRKLATSEMRKAQNAYQKSVKDLDKASQQARNALSLLKKEGGAEKVTIGAIQTMLAKASGEVGNLTEMERAAFSGRQDILSRLQRYATKTAFSELPTEDKNALKEIAQLYADAQDDLKTETARLLADQYSSVFDSDPDETVFKVSGGRIKPKAKPQEQSAPQPQGGGMNVLNYLE